MFNYDWFHGAAYKHQRDEAKRRCAERRYPDLDRGDDFQAERRRRFREELEVRTLIYLRDGFSYEIREIASVDIKSHLVFECVPVDEQYKVGAFVVTVPFEEIVRVEVFAVHPSEKPEDMPQITGFRGFPEMGDHKGDAVKPSKPVKPSKTR
jgi:hypothetical protein